jgi:hypothetical protein
MNEIVKMDEPGSSAHSENMPKRLHAQVCRSQLLISKLWAELDNTRFSVAWMTLKVEDRKNHVLHGMKEACEYAPWGQDTRALCPDITISSMMKDQGQGFTNFLEDCTGAVEKSGSDRVYLIWSEWWEKVVDMPQPWPDDVRTCSLYQKNKCTRHRHTLACSKRPKPPSPVQAQATNNLTQMTFKVQRPPESNIQPSC